MSLADTLLHFLFLALQKLSTLGIIETRVGEGSFVCSFSLKPLLQELSFLYEGEDAFRDVQQLRQMLEYNSAILAVSSATEEEKQALKEALDAYNLHAEQYLQDVDNQELLNAMVDADFQFHYTVIRMTHNRLFMDIYFAAQELIRENITRLISDRAHRRKEAGFPKLKHSDGHEIIYRCIVNSEIQPLHQVVDAMIGITPVENMDIFP